jgi:tetratricopeptide (TPR) repeat protein
MLAMSLLLLCSCSAVAARSAEEIREEKAQKYFQKGRKVEGDGALGVAISYYTMAIRLKPDMVEAYYHRANNHFDRLEDEEAMEDFSEVLKQLPQHTQARFNRGLAYLSLGETQKALADFLFLVKQNPNDLEAHKYAGIIYADYLTNPQQADYHFQYYLKMGGQDSEVSTWLTASSPILPQENAASNQQKITPKTKPVVTKNNRETK